MLTKTSPIRARLKFLLPAFITDLSSVRHPKFKQVAKLKRRWNKCACCFGFQELFITDEICFVFNIHSRKGAGLRGDLDALSSRLGSATQLRHEPWACEGMFICNSSLTQNTPCFCGWIQVDQFLHRHRVSLISVPGQTLLQDSNPCGCLSPDRNSIQGSPCIFGIRAHSHVWESSAGQGASLLSNPHHTSGEIPCREEEPPTD